MEAQPAIARPVTPAERLGAVDALRGLALFGVLAMNLETVFRVSIFEQLLPGPPPQGLDRAIDAGLAILLDFKALALFSLLFGVGLAIQFERLSRTSARTILLVRRMLALLAFGIVHLTLIWNGDILTEYALCGLVVLPLLFIGNEIMAAGALLLLVLYVFGSTPPGALPSPGWLQDRVTQAASAYGHGGYGAALAQRLRELPGIFALEALVFGRTAGLMLLGALAWRTGVIARAGEKPRAAALVGAALVLVGLVLTLASSARPYLGWTGLGPVGTMAGRASQILLALGYAALALAACASNTGAALLGWARPLGRMAFSNYIAQSLILGWVFYGYGLGLFNRLSLAQGLGLAVALYGGQAVVSRLWLARLRYGPLEWLWRRLMYGGLKQAVPAPVEAVG